MYTIALLRGKLADCILLSARLVDRALEVSIGLAALYLRGAPRASSAPLSRWPLVFETLSREPDPAEALSSRYFREETRILTDGRLMDWAEHQVRAAKVLTAADPGYPASWLAKLGSSAPPALWRTGEAPNASESVSLVGSRDPSPDAAEFCVQIGREVARLGRVLTSGGAQGCDSLAARACREAGGSVLEILAEGVAKRSPVEGVCRLSVCAPNEGFTGAQAMERNTLIHAASSHTVVGQARHGAGGTWIGATEALRRGLSVELIRDDGGLAARALVARGGVPIASADELEDKLRTSLAQEARLFE